MRNYLAEYESNIKLTHRLLDPLNQGLIKSEPPAGFLQWTFHYLPFIYNTSWMLFYFYLIFAQRISLETTCEQLWCLMTIVQLFAKMLNGFVNRNQLEKLLEWCRDNYTTKYKYKYQVIVDRVWEKNNVLIAMCIR